MATARNTRPTIAEITSDWLNACRARFGSRRPTACDTTVVVPTLNICVSAKTMNVKLPQRATPATASLPSRPTQ